MCQQKRPCAVGAFSLTRRETPLADKRGLLIAGEYASTNLSNGGELVTLVGASGATIKSFTYDDDLTMVVITIA